ncbi:hypothetical protein CCAX7_39200 [Capsulimonas corticalis]|uniref:Uncharacterized protein n=1 Tax=Capsulimonas corticalis TaxID=2219043 RepID=A0A402D3N8_9BACT|nr:hypothetical protein [Capsulimonas corticalis]BDI31869.1 hypothetical protein CCAX7_39200 [Capsulimonas corticalis]
MPKLTKIGIVPVEWNAAADRYFSAEENDYAEIFNRMKPVLDPMMVTVGPGAKAGGKYPWEGNDPKTGRRYVARKQRDADAVSLEEVVDA